MRTILVSIVIALFGGISVIMFLEYLDSTIRTAEEVRVYLDMPFLGYIPTVTERDVAKDVDKNLICYETQQSSTAEAYRTIRTSILFASPEDRPLKSILITSALPQEGKTFAASNLSLIFSQLNERVVLLDLDMRRPKLHKSFGLKQASGLSEYLTGNADLKTILNPTFADRLSVITAGTIPPNPSELLTSAKIKTLFSELTAKFDRIIIDSPPLLIVPDSSLLANMVDGAILLIKGGGTHLQAVTHAKDKVIQAKGRLIGAIINNLEVEKEDYYYYHYYYYKEKDKDQDQGDKSKLPQKEEAPPPPSPTQKR
jgi:capsular exopolysaccharide synthesis family protein